MISYDKIPEHCRAGMKRYIEEGAIPGGFLKAVICNNLVDTFTRADGINAVRVYDYVLFLCNEITGETWGSEKIMLAWHKKGGLKGGVI